MCGIFGVVLPRQSVDLKGLRKASESLVHRGPDGFGFLLSNREKTKAIYDTLELPDGSYNVALANRRLAIIDVGACRT